VTALNARSSGGRKRSILALNDPNSVYDALAPSQNLVSVSTGRVSLQRLLHALWSLHGGLLAL
jgi:hypothetical protein